MASFAPNGKPAKTIAAPAITASLAPAANIWQAWKAAGAGTRPRFLYFLNSLEEIMLGKFLNLFRAGRLDADLRAELEFHRSQTAGSLGNLTLVKECMRDASTIVWLETMLQDIRYGLRQLVKAPVLVTVAVLSLALGIGANTAIFTLINAVMLQSLPVPDPGRLVLFYNGIATGVYSGDNPQSDEFSYPFWRY